MPRQKQVSEEVKKQLDQVCKQVVLQEEIIKQKQQIEEQLAIAKQQLVSWDTKIKHLSGALANCNAILEKSQKAKTLELESDNTKPKEK